MRSTKFSLAGAGTIVKYSFKVSGRDQPPFLAGTGTALIQVGTSCFVDTTDSCTLSPSGSSARCE